MEPNFTFIISTCLYSLTITGNVGRGSFPGGDAGCTMILDSEDFLRMFQGQLTPMQALMAGKLQVRGDKMIRNET